jgi:hypothetical protein
MGRTAHLTERGIRILPRRCHDVGRVNWQDRRASAHGPVGLQNPSSLILGSLPVAGFSGLASSGLDCSLVDCAAVRH